MSIRIGPLLLLALWLLAACDYHQRIKIGVGQARAMVELANTLEQRRQGLMGRTELGPDQGMLLVFPTPDVLRIWMLNTPIPLDVGFFDADGRLINSVSMWPDGGRRIHASQGPALYALEMNLGWFARQGISAGDQLKLPFPVYAQ